MIRVSDRCPSLGTRPVRRGYAARMITGGILGALVLAVNIYVIYRVLVGPGSGLGKVLWIFIVLILPVVDVILWLLFGRK